MLTTWAEPVVADWEDAIAGGKGANAKEGESPRVARLRSQKTNGSLMQRAGQLFGHAIGWPIRLATGVEENLQTQGCVTGHLATQ